jgi:membrane fusion protein (multidrug efflux system)
MREAWLAVNRAEIRAPLSGQVARRQVQLGQRVAAGANLMSIVALDQVWVEANFKEGQLRDIRIGQPVTLTSDLYGSAVRFTGRIVGLGAGTGSAFSLLPAQNASGNWIKIVQRIPVRVAIDPQQLEKYPLRIGLSMRVVVDIQDRDGPMLGDAPPDSPSLSTDVFQSLDKGADEAVRRVIGEHLQARVSIGEAKAAAGPQPVRR